jgi:hypothetical protein
MRSVNAWAYGVLRLRNRFLMLIGTFASNRCCLVVRLGAFWARLLIADRSLRADGAAKKTSTRLEPNAI